MGKTWASNRKELELTKDTCWLLHLQEKRMEALINTPEAKAAAEHERQRIRNKYDREDRLRKVQCLMRYLHNFQCKQVCFITWL